MAEGISGIIKELRRMREGIEEALLALERVETIEAPPPHSQAPASAQAEAPNRRSEAQKARWAFKNKATKNAAASVSTEVGPAATTSAPRTPRFTAEGRKRLAEAMKRRWAVKRALSAVKKKARKKTA